MPRILLGFCGNLLFPLFTKLFQTFLHSPIVDAKSPTLTSAHIGDFIHVILYRKKKNWHYLIIWKYPELSTKSTNFPNIYPSCSSSPFLLFPLPSKAYPNYFKSYPFPPFSVTKYSLSSLMLSSLYIQNTLAIWITFSSFLGLSHTNHSPDLVIWEDKLVIDTL